MRTDVDVKNDVIDELKWEPSVDASRIDVSVENGTVTLSGVVPTYYEKTTAEEAALRVSGVESVVSNTDVEITTAFTRNDTDIADAAKNVLRWNTTVPEENIDITVENGWVTLDGEVEFSYQKTAANDAVKYLAGVRGITNQIKVRPTVEPEKAEEKIKDALRRDALVNSEEIDVSVEGNKARLQGTVSNWVEKNWVDRLVWATPGIFSVENDIVVRLPE